MKENVNLVKKQAQQARDLDLFAQVAQGSEKAFTEIFHTYNQKLYPFMVKMTRDEDHAREIIQEVFIKVWNHREDLGTVENPAGYLYTMAVNKAKNFLVKEANAQRAMRELAKTLEVAKNPTEEYVNYRERAAQLEQAISKLPPQRQLIFKLSREEGKNYDEIAAELNISRNTVKNQIIEALRTLRASAPDPIALVLLLKMLAR